MRVGSTRQFSNSPTHQFPNVILFDGVCNLCNGFVQFVIERDPDDRFQFGSLQSAAARRVLDQHHASSTLLDSVVLVEEGRLFTGSTAALRIVRRLRFPWSLAASMLVIPRPLRDWLYTGVARRRYRWFGKREHCMVPTPGLQSRFID
jgi:predicted DCC family thiol-disulfide oxidoreductase YuxK